VGTKTKTKTNAKHCSLVRVGSIIWRLMLADRVGLPKTCSKHVSGPRPVGLRIAQRALGARQAPKTGCCRFCRTGASSTEPIPPIKKPRKCGAFLLADRVVVPQARLFNPLSCQTTLFGPLDIQELFPALSNPDLSLRPQALLNIGRAI
jgi:hypothetical protein